MTGLEETLEAVKAINGVTYVGKMPDRQPRVLDGERLLVVQDQIIKARVVDITNPEWLHHSSQRSIFWLFN